MRSCSGCCDLDGEAQKRAVYVLSYVLERTSFASRCVAMPSDSPGDAESFGSGELKTCSEEDRLVSVENSHERRM
eukprot:30068-Pelagococcus_subviridis.AAC.2